MLSAFVTFVCHFIHLECCRMRKTELIQLHIDFCGAEKDAKSIVPNAKNGIWISCLQKRRRAQWRKETFLAINLALTCAKVRQDFLFPCRRHDHHHHHSHQHSPHDINSNDCNVQPATEAEQYENCLRDQKTVDRRKNEHRTAKILLQNVGTFPIVNLLPCAPPRHETHARE